MDPDDDLPVWKKAVGYTCITLWLAYVLWWTIAMWAQVAFEVMT